MSIAISVPDVHSESLLTLIKDYAICNYEIKISRDKIYETVQFNTEDGKKLTGGIAAARYVASLGSRSAQLLGNSPEDRSKIAEVISLTSFMSKGILDGQLEMLDSWLENRTFAVGKMVTLADLILYANTSSSIKKLPGAQHMHFRNILRWYDNIRYMADSGAIFPKVAFRKPKFSYVPPVMKLSQQTNAGSKPVKTEKADEKTLKKEDKGRSTQEGGSSMASKKEAPKKEVSKNDKPPKKEKGGPKEEPTIDFLDIRVGLIRSIGPHPNADALYVEEIDLGEEKPRTVVSGLRKFVSEDEMKNRKVAVVCNLKPAKMRDVMSYGMVLCASNADHTEVDPILIPDGSSIGSRITCEGFDREAEAQINPKKKIFEKIAPDLVTDKGMFLLCGYF